MSTKQYMKFNLEMVMEIVGPCKGAHSHTDSWKAASSEARSYGHNRKQTHILICSLRPLPASQFSVGDGLKVTASFTTY
jgi:hypothetical protein